VFSRLQTAKLTVPNSANCVSYTPKPTGDHSQSGEEISYVAQPGDRKTHEKYDGPLQGFKSNPDHQTQPANDGPQTYERDEWALFQRNCASILGLHLLHEFLCITPIHTAYFTKLLDDVISLMVLAELTDYKVYCFLALHSDSFVACVVGGY
jgi:hypothetical protein